MARLESAEQRILTDVWPHIDLSDFIQIDDGSKSIRTIGLNTQSRGIPLVLLHGMGSGVGLWILNLRALSQERPVYAIDILGFGRSSRPKFSKDAMQTETEFVRSIEEWRRKMELDKFIMLGHSFGGYLATAYALEYAHHLYHLILVDPWGFLDHEAQENQRRSLPCWAKVIAKLLEPYNPFAALRLAGPLGPYVVKRIRRDLVETFSGSAGGDVVPEYISHCIAGRPSGEAGFKSLTVSLAWARYPMLNRIKELDPALGITMIHGELSWLDNNIGYKVKYLRTGCHVDVHVLDDAGHHVYADAAEDFNRLVNSACRHVDTWAESPPVRLVHSATAYKGRATSTPQAAAQGTSGSSPGNPTPATNLTSKSIGQSGTLDLSADSKTVTSGGNQEIAVEDDIIYDDGES